MPVGHEGGQPRKLVLAELHACGQCRSLRRRPAMKEVASCCRMRCARRVAGVLPSGASEVGPGVTASRRRFHCTGARAVPGDVRPVRSRAVVLTAVIVACRRYQIERYAGLRAAE